ncbi:MAG: TM0106 family RecB-like putative nuclease [Roseofilum sp. SBFL]|uniref:TM0106 family RecB-like putative nuclease n=1 Tax=unclassified Roseofilum TaxID=2620099 RepID=UPI001B03826B|nr:MULTISPECIES: TM0106 family RecB-like putative nuclease [unclassified Roseofilum]MBP0012696.1 TM0106 family RecB-like putative nuclease [Roseofilum sp. SID3]MBP0026337.1 TM0106 family RecB-like putative nuclease [Roseofilum sp. SID2]MBP0040006.1 TM0106 family RecB-like putative nuclease [Roseofilum sp. SID1]MBP0042351.1 TM0106 family RecB-like putative nuclease [Roseofilum sp. SBFL]
MLLTAQLLLDYQRCHRRAFLDMYGDDRQRDPPSDYLLKLRQDSSAYQKTILAHHSYDKPKYTHGNWQEGALATLALMQEGVETIYHGVLWLGEMDLEFLDLPHFLPQHWAKFSCLSHPTLWVKTPGESKFGPWKYTPVDIKWGKRPKREYQMVSVFHAWILSQIQGEWPDKGELVLRERSPYTVDLVRLWPDFQSLLTEMLTMLLESDEPEVFISRQKCSLCQWLTGCHQVAQQQNHLSLIPGITPKRYERLQELGLTSLESLTPEQLPDLAPEFGQQVSVQIIRQAQSSLEQRAIALHPWTPEDFPITPVELYFDIETEPDLNLEYLLGVLVIDRTAQRSRFYPFLARSPDDQEQMWQAFLELVNRYHPMPIFHFCEYEIKAVNTLGQRFGTPASELKPLIRRFVDIHERVTRFVTLPIESYALKTIARWMAFEWRDENASGAQTVYWYDQWLKSGDRSFLDRIICYNEDDCRATYHVKEWLVSFLQQMPAPNQQIPLQSVHIGDFGQMTPTVKSLFLE